MALPRLSRGVAVNSTFSAHFVEGSHTHPQDNFGNNTLLGHHVTATRRIFTQSLHRKIRVIIIAHGRGQKGTNTVTAVKGTLMTQLGAHCRRSAVTLIAGVCRWRSIGEINDWMLASPVRKQALVTTSVLGAVLAVSLLAAQFGWIGMLVFFLAIVLIVN